MSIVNSVPYSNTSVSSTAILVVAGTIKIDVIKVRNPNTSEVFVQLFDAATAASVTVGTTSNKDFIPVQSGDGTNSGLTSEDFSVSPPLYISGLVIAATTSPSNNTAPSSACAVSIKYHY